MYLMFCYSKVIAIFSVLNCLYFSIDNTLVHLHLDLFFKRELTLLIRKQQITRSAGKTSHITSPG